MIGDVYVCGLMIGDICVLISSVLKTNNLLACFFEALYACARML